MHKTLRISQLGIVFAIFAGLFLLGTLTADAARSDPSPRLSISEERYLDHFCPAYRARGYEPAYCDGVQPEPEPEPEPEAPTVDIDADPLMVEVGETTTVSWSSEHADSCEASDDWSGSKSTSGSLELTVNATSTYTITCTGDGGEASESVTVAAYVVPEPEPEPEKPTLELSVDPAVVPLGGTTTISWAATGVDTCEASGDWSGDKALSGSEELLVASTSTYTLTCLGEGTSISKSIGVAVTEPEAEPPTLDFSISSTSVPVGGSTTISWSAANVDTCEASDDWSGDKGLSGSEEVVVNATSTYTLTCTGDGGVVSQSIGVGVYEVSPEPEPEPSVDHIVISEVLYDLSSEQGSEIGGANEWVELYNPTDAAVDLAGWLIGNGSSNDVISDTSLVLDPGAYLVITNATTTALYWDFASTTVVYLGSSISGGLANAGDVVVLYNADTAAIDAVSYGSNYNAFDPNVPDVGEGSSIERTDLSVDTDTAADWSENLAPTPGS